MNLKQNLSILAKKSKLDKQLAYVYTKLFSSHKSLLINPKIIHYSKDADCNSNNVILFPLLCGGRSIELTLQSILSHAFNLRDVQSHFILCDCKLPICIAKTAKNIKFNSCYYCYYLGKDIATNMNININWVGDYIGNGDISKANDYISSYDFKDYPLVEYKGVNIGLFSESATKRYLSKGIIDDSEYNRVIFKECLVSGVILVDLSERIFNKIKPTHLILSNTPYLPGIFLEYFNTKDVKCIGCDFFVSDNKLMIGQLNKECKSLYDIPQKTWEKYQKIKLLNYQKKELENLLKSRAEGSNMVVNYGEFSTKKSSKRILELLKIDNTKDIGLLFTNLAWDASLAGTSSIFQDQFEWISETINWFSSHSNRSLIIKVHPAEEIIGTAQSVLSFINSEFKVLPTNIKIISPRSEINTYDLFNIVDYGIVYTSTAGLEMAMYGIPTIVAAETHYKRKGFTYDVKDKENYFNLLEKNKLNSSMNEKELANKYGYMHFCDRQIPFKYIEFEGKLFTQPKLNLNCWKELLPGVDDNLDLICNGILCDNEFFKSRMVKQ